MVSFVKQRSVINLAKPCLERICFLSSAVHGAPVVCLKEFRTTRMFLAMYLLHRHPRCVFNNIGTTEMALIKAIQLVVAEFDEIVLIIKSSKSFYKVPSELSKRFSLHLNQFFEIFTTWETDSKAPLWASMRLCLVSLYLAFFSFPRPDASVRLDLQSQILKLRQRALECAGRGVIDMLDADLRAGKFGLPPIDTEQLGTLESDPTFFLLGNLEQIQLVQELLLDINYKATKESLNEVPMHVYVTSSRDSGSHWNDALIGLISFPPCFEPIRVSFREFKARIVNLATGGRKSCVQTSIDVDFPPCWDGCVSSLSSIRDAIRLIQMPTRDKLTDAGWDAIGAITTPEAMINALKYTHKIISETELDFYNVRVLMVSRIMNENGVVYIDQRYQALLGSGALTMERTNAWISIAVDDSLASGSVTLSELRPLSAMGSAKVLYSGYDRLVFKSIHNNEHDFPETFLLDVWRLCSLQRKFRVDFAAVCMLSNLSILLFHCKPVERLSILERVSQIFQKLAYDSRGLDDWELMLSGDEDLLDSIKAVLPDGVCHDPLSDCLDMTSRKFQNM
jgi:hypothetical protein